MGSVSGLLSGIANTASSAGSTAMDFGKGAINAMPDNSIGGFARNTMSNFQKLSGENLAAGAGQIKPGVMQTLGAFGNSLTEAGGQAVTAIGTKVADRIKQGNSDEENKKTQVAFGVAPRITPEAIQEEYVLKPFTDYFNNNEG